MVVINVSFHIVRSTENARSLSTCGIITHVHNSPYNFYIFQIGPTFGLVGMHELSIYEKLNIHIPHWPVGLCIVAREQRWTSRPFQCHLLHVHPTIHYRGPLTALVPRSLFQKCSRRVLCSWR